MALRVELTASAFEDLRELYDFIAEDSPRAAEQLLAAIQGRLTSRGEFPEHLIAHSRRDMQRLLARRLLS